MLSGEFPLSDFYETPEPMEYRQPVWMPKKASETKSVTDDPAPAGSCEFVGVRIYEGSEGRKCKFGSVCFLFAEPVLYVLCPTRIEKLKEKT